jgi:hypothetical protein
MGPDGVQNARGSLDDLRIGRYPGSHRLQLYPILYVRDC